MTEKHLSDRRPPGGSSVNAPSDVAPTDARLLEAFITRRDEHAFALLVARHGPMVWSVCRRLLREVHDAEDAFQATFLVLVKSAARIQKRELLANWLYGVAYKIAARARAQVGRRRDREASEDIGQAVAPALDKGSQWQPAIDEEVHRLPDKYRRPVVLCYLEGKSNEEAAEDLRCPVGTVKGRLARAREILRRRLARRGLALSIALVMADLTAAAPAALPASLVEETVVAGLEFAAGGALTSGFISPGAASLARETLLSLHRARVVKWAAFCAGVGALVIALLVSLLVGFSGPRHDKDRIQGTWRISNMVWEGKPVPRGFDIRWTFQGDQLITDMGGRVMLRFQLDPEKQPKAMDTLPWVPPPPNMPRSPPRTYVYELEGDTLKVAVPLRGTERPKEVAAGPGLALFIFQRDLGIRN